MMEFMFAHPILSSAIAIVIAIVAIFAFYIVIKRWSTLSYISAVINNNWEKAKWMAMLGADINAKIYTDTPALLKVAIFDRWELVQCLVKHGADVNAKDKYGETVLNSGSSGKLVPSVSAGQSVHGFDGLNGFSPIC